MGKRTMMFGFLYRGLKKEYYLFRQIDFLTNTLFVVSFALSWDASLVSLCLAFGLKVILVAHFWPFNKFLSNVGWLVLGVLKTIYVLFFLFLRLSIEPDESTHIQIILGI